MCKKATFGQIAASLMNALAEHPELRDMELAVEIREGKEYRNITGIESFFRCHVDTSKNKVDDVTTAMAFKLDWDN